jgi:threonine dehydrogenase-like Zn-dependent dehydrogenase
VDVKFQTLEYGSDQEFHPVEIRFQGSESEGWAIDRNGESHLRLGPGYVLLQSKACGVCSTDLARHHLPFPLPQITGHEVLAVDSDGRRFAIEINASHLARGVKSDCEFCNEGMHTHCPERLVLGIHDLPGGFGPWILAPKDALVPLPDSISDKTALLLEPFAAASHIADICPIDNGMRIAVLGPRRLGQLTIAALTVLRRQVEIDCHVTALTRHQRLADLAKKLGADDAIVFEGTGDKLPLATWDLVIDTTGSPTGLELALRLAAAHVHVKSTHGQPAGGLQHLTEMVVDELCMARLPSRRAEWNDFVHRQAFGAMKKLLWAAKGAPPKELRKRAKITRAQPGNLPRVALRTFDHAICDSLSSADAILRPYADEEASFLRPHGALLLDLPNTERSPVADAIRDRGLCVSTSRCGDMRKALHLLNGDPLGQDLGKILMSDLLPASDIARAFDLAGSPDVIKVGIEQSN